MSIPVNTLDKISSTGMKTDYGFSVFELQWEVS
jgi:hypothetical protein